MKIGDDMVTDTSAPLSYAGLTAYGAVKNAGLKPDDMYSIHSIVNIWSYIDSRKRRWRLVQPLTLNIY